MALQPDQRALLLDALRPPDGMVVDRAVGTTFSLDLMALLTAPLAFALFDVRLADAGDRTTIDPVGLLEAVRRHADRLDVFHQAGQISLPSPYQPILCYLEESVHAALPPSRLGIFHPKVWVIRFASPNRSELRYRLLVLSRNLTFDRSWDTVVQLDGSPGGPNPVNIPVADFLTALPGLAVLDLADRGDGIRAIADELRTVAWDLPEGVEQISFHPTGIEGYPARFPETAGSLMVISPFLTRSAVARFGNLADKPILISRPESLDRIPGEDLNRFGQVLVLADGAGGPLDADTTPEQSQVLPTEEAIGEGTGYPMVGLHAKVIVAERSRRATITTGSTNLTDAGYGPNVEFSVALTGPTGRLGVGAVLGQVDEEGSLRRLLVEYRRSEEAPKEPTDAERLAMKLELLGRQIAGMALTAVVESSDEGLTRLSLTSDYALPHDEGLDVRCRPITRPADTAALLAPGTPVRAEFASLSLQALTSFFAFELSFPAIDRDVVLSVTVNSRLIGAPDDRLQRLLSLLLDSREKVLRYLLLLLSDVGDDSMAEIRVLLAQRPGEAGGSARYQMPLLETMVRALARRPAALDPVARLIDDLSATKEGRALLPDGLELVWPAIWKARQEMAQ